MTRRPATFRKADLERAIKAAIEAGLRVAEAVITRDGAIKLVFVTPATVAPSATNDWD
jgi:hypothetical protein